MKAMKKIAVLALAAGLFVSAVQGYAAPKDSTWLSSESVMMSSIDKSTDSSPLGMITIWATSDPVPEGWLECNGQTVDATKYPAYVTKFGNTTPDYRGFFLRGYGGKSGALGAAQDYAVQTNGLNSISLSGIGMQDIDFLSGVTYSSSSNLEALNSKLENYHNKIYSQNWANSNNAGTGNGNSDNGNSNNNSWAIGDYPVSQPCTSDDECLHVGVSYIDNDNNLQGIRLTFPFSYLVNYAIRRGAYTSGGGMVTYDPACYLRNDPEYPINEDMLFKAKQKALYEYYKNFDFNYGDQQRIAINDSHSYLHYTKVFGPHLYEILASNYSLNDKTKRNMSTAYCSDYHFDAKAPASVVGDKPAKWLNCAQSMGYVVFQNMKTDEGFGQYIGVRLDPQQVRASLLPFFQSRLSTTTANISCGGRDKAMSVDQFPENMDFLNRQNNIWFKEFDDFISSLNLANVRDFDLWEHNDLTSGRSNYRLFKYLIEELGEMPSPVPYSPVTWIEYDGIGKFGLGGSGSAGSGSSSGSGDNSGSGDGSTSGTTAPVEIPKFEGISGPLYTGSISTTSSSQTVVMKKAGENIGDLSIQITSEAGETRPVNKAVRYIVKVE